MTRTLRAGLTTATWFAVAAGLLTGCIAWAGQLTGSGHRGSETRTLPAFSRVAIEGSVDADVRVGGAQTLVVEGDDNLLSNVRTEVQGDTLAISAEKSYSSRIGMKVRLTVPRLDGLEIHGSGDVHAEGVRSDAFKVAVAGSGDVSVRGTATHIDIAVRGSGDVSLEDAEAADVSVSIHGSGDVRVRGTAGQLKVDVHGSGDVNCADLRTKEATVAIRGSGDVQVNTSESLDADVEGSGSVSYAGDPARVHKTGYGSGEVVKR